MSETEFKRLSPLTPLVRGGIFLLAVVGAMWQNVLDGELGTVGIVMLGVIVAGAGYGTLSWWRTKYWIEGDELRVDTGVISRQSRRIRIDRLQAVDIVQPFVARLLGLAELKMDVAGGGKAEGSLAFMPIAEAHGLKEQLLARRDNEREDNPPDVVAAPAVVVPIARLDLGMLVVSLLLSGEFIGFVLAGVALVSVGAVAGSIGAAGGLLPVVGGFAVVVVRKLAGFYNFTVSDTPGGLQVRRGLFELTSQTVALPRVQGVVVSEPLLWRPMGWAKLDVSVAGTKVGDGNDQLLSSTVLPVGPREEVLALARHVLRGLDLTDVPLTAPPDRAKWVEPIGRFFVAGGLDERMLVSRTGWWTRKTHAVPHRRVQSVRLSQGPWLRRLRLAQLYVDSPPGPVRVRLHFRDETEARYLLERAVVLGRQARAGAGTPTAETTQ